MANLDYIIDEVEKLQKKEKSLAKHLDPEKNYEMNKSSTEDIESHPDYKRKLDEFDGWGYIYNEEGERDYGNLNEEGKFIFDKDKEEVIDDKDEILIDDKDEIVVDDKDEVENKIEIEGGAALSDKILLPREKPTLHKKKNAFANFTENVGSAFENIATALPKKMEEVFADKDRKRMFLRGLEIINSSSGLTSLSQAKSPLGKISEGLLKAESKFAAEDLAKYKAENPMRRYESIGEKAIYDDFKVWYDGVTKTMGLLISMFILFLIGWLFVDYNYQLRFGAIYFGCILLAGDFLEIYYGLIRNVARKVKNKFVYLRNKNN